MRIRYRLLAEEYVCVVWSIHSQQDLLHNYRGNNAYAAIYARELE